MKSRYDDYLKPVIAFLSLLLLAVIGIIIIPGTGLWCKIFGTTEPPGEILLRKLKGGDEDGD
ncbi:MAG: hypothetical protein Sv326_1315 (plasmid) [Candidatus Fermentimicrarchaeum limneticum]|uniref:Uncharacterized protein n=1 Tax=Fermentimicrarchaeum limneticum TaxID=2795018 RepID=A0A7D5XKG9_FERL1|nr:MAG: hypothetical protein Sv326_1315 [Candidatus Fermentimicrarchaeum limneticum]